MRFGLARGFACARVPDVVRQARGCAPQPVSSGMLPPIRTSHQPQAFYSVANLVIGLARPLAVGAVQCNSWFCGRHVPGTPANPNRVCHKVFISCYWIKLKLLLTLIALNCLVSSIAACFATTISGWNQASSVTDLPMATRFLCCRSTRPLYHLLLQRLQIFSFKVRARFDGPLFGRSFGSFCRNLIQIESSTLPLLLTL